MKLSLCSRSLDARPAILAALIIILTSSAGILRAESDNRPIVVLREDDCSRSWTTPFAGLGGISGLAYGKAKRIPITWAVITNNATAGTSLTWAELKDYVDSAGGELASHSCSHSALPTEAEYIEEITNSKAAMESHLPGYVCKSFVQPGVWKGSAYLDDYLKSQNLIAQTIAAKYVESQAYLARGWHVGTVSMKHGTTYDYILDYPHTQTTASTLAILDTVASTPGLVFVIVCHALQETNGTAQYATRADVLKATLDKLAELRDSGSIRLASLRDAYNATFPVSLNHVPDPGFELSSTESSSSIGPWFFGGAARIQDSGGVDDSRCTVLGCSSDFVKSYSLRLPAGRYVLNWWQKPLPGYTPSKTVLHWVSCRSASECYYASTWTGSPNSSAEWEEKSLLFVVKDGFPMTAIGFAPSAEAAYAIDNVSVVLAPISPAVSVTNTSVVARPGMCTISWDTPMDPSVTRIAARCSAVTHPTTNTAGMLLGTNAALPGTRQQMAAPLDWTTLQYLYVSLFAAKSDGSSAPPDLAVVKIDNTPPATPAIEPVNRTFGDYNASWTSQDLESGIYQYYYAVGTGPARSNIVPWTATASASVRLTGLPEQSTLYFSVKAENPFGQRSVTATAVIRSTGSVSDALSSPDGLSVNVTGIISAVFDGYYYIETPGRAAGIRVLGYTTSCEGDEITASGRMTSISGERAVDAGP